MNVGGDIVQGTRARIEYFNTVTSQKNDHWDLTAYVMAPGEVVTFDLEYVLPEDQLLGEYQAVAMVDKDDEVEENKEDNNEIKSNIIQLSDIKLLLPTDGFVFEENGLFLFSGTVWYSVSLKSRLEWMTNLRTEGHSLIYLRETDGLPTRKLFLFRASYQNGNGSDEIVGKKQTLLAGNRQASGQQTISEIRTFSINPVTGGNKLVNNFLRNFHEENFILSIFSMSYPLSLRRVSISTSSFSSIFFSCDMTQTKLLSGTPITVYSYSGSISTIR